MTRVPVCPNPNCECVVFSDSEYQLSKEKVTMVICASCGWIVGLVPSKK